MVLCPASVSFFFESVCDTMMLGANDKTNPHNLIHSFGKVVMKMRAGHVDSTSNFPAPLVVPSRKTSKK
jgi:hypothetical protein